MTRLALLVLTLILLFAPSAQAAPDPNTCVGYPQPRIFLESQAWWQTTPGMAGTDFGHVHTGMCFPYRQTVAGVISVDVVTKLHENPGFFRDIIFEARNEAWANNPMQLRPRFITGRTCDVDDCTWIDTVTIDTRVLPVDGLWQFRIRSRVTEPDGNTSMPSNAFPVDVENGKTDRNGPTWTQGRGWYGVLNVNDFGYQDVRFDDVIPTAPVPNTWSPLLRTNRVQGDVTGSVTRSLVLIDPAFHAVPPSFGTVALDTAGPISRRVAIDTTNLAPGPHRLVVISESANIGGSGSTLSGVLAIPFSK